MLRRLSDLGARWSNVFERAKKWKLSLGETFHLEWLTPFVRKINAR